MRFSLSIFTALLGLCLFLAQPLSKAADDNQPIYVLTIDGAISPAYSDYMTAGLNKAKSNNAQLLIIKLNTPGGLLSTTREMATAIIQSPIPIAVWVTPSGAHAASAGTFILYAAHIAAMDESTNVGAATPIQMKGQLKGQLDEPVRGQDARDKQSVDESESEQNIQDMLKELMDPDAQAVQQKAIEDTAAFIRGLAELRGRNAEWAEKSVTEADSITAKEALDMNVIDYIARNQSQLLEKIDGKTIPIKNAAPVTLNTSHAPIVNFEPDWKTKLLAIITDPNVALILMSIGVYGLILEFYNPGTLVPGTIGAISLILGLYALNVLPINTAGVILMGLGFIFFIAEAFVPSFGIMGFGGLAAFMFGAAIMYDTESMPGMALNWGIFFGIGIVGLLLLGLIVFLTVKVYRNKISTGPESMIGSYGTITEWDGVEGRVQVRGELWHAVSDDELILKRDDEVLISAVNDLTVKIRTKP